jgi:hypothetical protein
MLDHAVENVETKKNLRMLEVFSPTEGKKIGQFPSVSVYEASERRSFDSGFINF